MKKSILFFLLILSASFLTEENLISELKNRSDAYFANTARAKLNLLFNQPKYAPGDTAYFRTLYLNAAELKPLKGNQIVHIYLFDQYGKRKMAHWVSVNDGLTSNKMVIPEDLVPGNYVLVAFTNWMKNLDKSLFFRKQFLVSGQNLFERKPAKDSLLFFVEGGSLIEGIENNVAVRYTGNRAKAKAIMKESGKDLMVLNLVRDSVSTFRLKPTSAEGYAVELWIDNHVKKFELPSITSSGISILCDASNRQVKLGLECAERNNFDNSHLYLLVFNNKGLAFHAPLDFSLERTKQIFLPQNLNSGIAQVVVSDSKFKILANRVIYLEGKEKRTLKLEHLSNNWTTRQPVKINAQIIDNDGYGTDGIFACNVINSALFSSTDSNMDYLTFTSDISNTFELPKEYSTSVIINNYLITQNCPWFDWEKITKKNQPPLDFKAEQYLTFSGRAIYAKNGQPVKDSTMIMFFLENSLRGYETYTHSKGHFSFPLVLNVYSPDLFFYTASFKGKDADEIKIKINDPDSLVAFRAEARTIREDADPYFEYSSRRKAIDNSYSFFVNPKVMGDSTFDPNQAMEEELNGADINLQMKNYLLMPTMEDVSKELLRGVEYRKINGRHVVRVNTTGKAPNNYAGPLYVIDGQITKDPSYFMNLKPADVIYIKVVKDSQKLMALGKLGANGVILLKTKNHVTVNERNRIEFSGFLPVAPIFSRGILNSSLPDFRSCLFWSPLIHSSSVGPTEIQFTSSDDIGNFKVQIYGLAENGIPFYFEQPFEVKYSGN
ncbi:MAG: hypothetical protein HY015_03595 [Bacteroidetes bacterium]|nr:hypothetical protein [Bacteroidota bacterium]MBI3482047.1 hypothetical protein [Bacteroidota bacterium]